MAVIRRTLCPDPGLHRGRSTIRAGMDVAAEGSAPERLSARERILETAYELFSRHGTRAVGVDRIIAECGIAKMTLYRNFRSKDELILAFLERRDEQWTRAWLQAEAQRRGDTPAQQLLAIFDTFEGWFAREDFEGCSFINVMLEVAACDTRVRGGSARPLPDTRAFAGVSAKRAASGAPDGFARQWHILMKGSIVSA